MCKRASISTALAQRLFNAGGFPHACDHRRIEEVIVGAVRVFGDPPHFLAAAPPHLGVPLLESLLVTDRHSLNDVIGDRPALAIIAVEQVLSGLAADHLTELFAKICSVL